MQFGLTATSQKTSIFSWMIITHAVSNTVFGCTEGWKTLAAANGRNTLNLMQLSPEAHASDVMLCGETVFQSCGGMLRLGSRPYKAKGTPGWIKITGG
ncbi:hypothetical protein CgunFtcFv8_022552 [Champsocephalus gunnari]|uniref:Uncharacterized protein n=2 Tax=Champsocephalus gunnari TaxID=52237 RepID=A0AAN8HXK9_CHAGU|nr:hypothetical protein CgunFtcFv8_022552 [Champsocephalus gunnari]